MQSDVYQRLAEHLDRLPDGFDPSPSGPNIELLHYLFSPEQAELAIHLTLDRADAATIARRAGLGEAVAAARLEEMALEGLIFSVHPPDGPPLYSAIPWIVGIWEFQIGRMSPEFLDRAEAYWRTAKPKPKAPALGQMRTIPIGESLTPELNVLPHDQVAALVDAHDRFAVAECICRKTEHMHGEGCDAPLETCLQFGDLADYFVRGGMGRAIDKEEVLAILKRANEANLVLQPTNSQEVSAICCCCGCCCGILGGLKRAEKPAEAVQNAFIAQFDADLCVACWTCLDRCQMEALSDDSDRVALNGDRCIGCGLCVSTCPSGALTLTRKPGQPAYELPPTFEETYKVIARQQASAPQA